MSNVRKVLMLVENCPPMADNRVWSEATALRDYGFQVTIIGPRGLSQQDRERHTYIDGIHVYRYPESAMGDKTSTYVWEYCMATLMMAVLSLKVLYRHGFAVIHAANPPDTLFILGLLYRLLGKKLIFDQHDLMPELFVAKYGAHRKALHKLLLYLERCSYRAAHAVITTNESLRRFAIGRGGCPDEKVFVVRNGPDLDQFKLVETEPKLKGGRPYLLLYIGVMEVQDGVEYVLYALQRLINRHGRRDVSLVMIGDGSQLAALQALAHELEIAAYVTFTGWLQTDDLMHYLAVADIGVTPDPANGLNEYCTLVKTMEYMAMGKPVVAFDLAETRLSAQGAALYATPNDVDDFANKINILLDDEELRLKMGALGRARVEEALHWDRQKCNLLRAYERAFSRSIKPLPMIR